MANWVDVLAEAARKRWESHHAFLLAQIPHLMESHEINIRLIQSGRTLRETIATEASQHLQLVKNPKAELVWGVVPRTADLPHDLSPLFHRAATGPQAPRYQRWFWTAFIKPIAPNSQRYVSDGSFSDIPETDQAPSGGVAISKTDVVETQPGAPVDNGLVQKAIAQWSARTGTKLEKFYLDAHPRRANEPTPALPVQKLAALDVEDLKRIMVPLDIVLKLMR